LKGAGKMSSVETKNGRDEKNKKIFSSGELNGTKSLLINYDHKKRR
jgi:hypothetical protein